MPIAIIDNWKKTAKLGKEIDRLRVTGLKFSKSRTKGLPGTDKSKIDSLLLRFSQSVCSVQFSYSSVQFDVLSD